jgi:L-threonylcarbamoyladenylate synthase
MEIGESSENSVTPDDLQKAVRIIRDGGVVAFPTETYYGLACDPFNKAALSRLFALKRRPPDKPVLTLVRDKTQLHLLAEYIPDIFMPLMRSFWPGPLSLIFPAQENLPEILTGYTATVGVRVSSHPVARRLVEAAAQPITATSANFSGQNAAICAQEVGDQLGPDIDFILDAGETPGGKGSTIVGLNDAGGLLLIREGVILYDQIAARLAEETDSTA